MIRNRDCFEQFMEEDTTIDQYISKIPLNGQWGGHAEKRLFPFLRYTMFKYKCLIH